MPFVVLNKIKVVSLLRLIVKAKEGAGDGDFMVFAGYVKVTNCTSS